MTSSEKYVSDVTLEYLLNHTLFQQIYKNKMTYKKKGLKFI